MIAMTLNEPTPQRLGTQAAEKPAFMRLGLIREAWKVGGEAAALDMCKHLAQARPAAARVAVLEIEGLCLYQRWTNDTGLPTEAATMLIEALGGSTHQFFQGEALDNGLRLIPNKGN